MTLFLMIFPHISLHDASYIVGLSKQKKIGLDWYEFLCFENPLRN